MPQAPLVEIFRYVASGLVVFFYLYIANPCAAKGLLETVGAATIAAGTLVVGALTYIVYRGFIFIPLVTHFRDTHPPTYRTWLKEEYYLTLPQAILLYALVRPELRGQTPERATHFANVHYGYTASLLTLPFFVVSLCSKRPLFGLLLLLFGGVLFYATLLFHERGEDEELVGLKELAANYPGTLNELAEIVRDINRVRPPQQVNQSVRRADDDFPL